jgi:hypothetical protein
MKSYSTYYTLTLTFNGGKFPVTTAWSLKEDALTEYEFAKQFYGNELAGARLDHPWETIYGRTDQFCECF